MQTVGISGHYSEARSGSMWKLVEVSEASGRQWKQVEDKWKVQKTCGSKWKTRKGQEGVRKAVGEGGRGEETWESNSTLHHPLPPSLFWAFPACAWHQGHSLGPLHCCQLGSWSPCHCCIAGKYVVSEMNLHFLTMYDFLGMSTTAHLPPLGHSLQALPLGRLKFFVER